MNRAAVLGRPVGHSLSPLLHRAAYAALGLEDWTYDALDIGAEDLPVLLAGLGEEWRGFSVTMPCKQAAVAVADVVDPLPRLLDAANTLVRTGAGWRAENTDVTGVGMALQLAGVERVSTAAIVGAGGTAAAAAVALCSLGAQHVDVVVRDPARAVDVVRVLDVLASRPRSPRWPTPTWTSRSWSAPCRSTRSPPCSVCRWRRRPDRARRPLRALADAAGAGRHRGGGTVVSGLEVLFWQATRPGGADDRPAGADRRDARRARRPLSTGSPCPARS